MASRHGKNTNVKRCKNLYIVISCLVCAQIYIEYTMFTLNQSEIYKVKGLMETKMLEGEGSKQIKRGANTSDTRYQAIEADDGEIRTTGTEGVGLAPQRPAWKKFFNNNTQEREKRNIPVTTSKIINKFRSKCDILSQDALSAINRSTSIECKQKIADIVCENQSQYYFAEKLPRFCPLKGVNKGLYMGCYNDSFEKRLLGEAVAVYETQNSPEKCINTCLGAGNACDTGDKLSSTLDCCHQAGHTWLVHCAGLNFAGVEYSKECWCGNSIERGLQLPEDRCNMTCPDKSHRMCGGPLALNIYQTGYGQSPDPQAPYRNDHVSPDSSVKIVFVLLLSGRGLRQIKQLLRMIYSVQHYYYIHVDSRYDYLHRELQSVQQHLSNVYVTNKRLATLWSGPSLLTAQLNCMKDILEIKHWKWDYFVNLSESHFPLRPLNELVNFLTMYKGMNFVTGTTIKGQDLIDTSAYDTMFVECDDYVWKIGPRHFPWGIALDAGSDWYMLHYNFVEYVTNSKDDLVEPLKVYFNYSIAAAESFFHLVLLNSIFCTTYVSNNINVIVWDRQRGCRCSEGVDWCMCSPMVQRQENFEYLTKVANETYFKYFARKFDAIVSQTIMTNLERVITRTDKSDDISMDSYWLNIFDHRDTDVAQDDAYITYYHSFIRRVLEKIKNNNKQKCYVSFSKLLQVYAYTYKDIFQGLIVQTEIQSDTGLHVMEIFVQPWDYFNKYNGTRATQLIQYMHVGTHWDKKEEIFRNFGKLMGPYSKIMLAVHWTNSQAEMNFTLNVIYIDPRKKVVGTFNVTVKEKDRTTTHTPAFEGPLIPGVWNIQVFFNGTWTILAQTVFIIIPLSHVNNKPISAQDASRIHNGGPYARNTSQNFEFKGVNSTEYQERVEVNARKSGSELLVWIDKESYASHAVKEGCIAAGYNFSLSCGVLPRCHQVYWSSFLPDSKSDLSSFYDR